MPENENTTSLDKRSEAIDLYRGIKSFQTSHGSVYTKLPDGSFSRHKFDGSDHEPLEWTMFVDTDDTNDLMRALTHGRKDKPVFFVMAEYDKDGKIINILDTRNDVDDLDNDFGLAVFKTDENNDDQVILQISISFVPRIGHSVFEVDSNRYGYHFGHEVSQIEKI
jgi:hypothetical protein